MQRSITESRAARSPVLVALATSLLPGLGSIPELRPTPSVQARDACFAAVQAAASH